MKIFGFDIKNNKLQSKISELDNKCKVLDSQIAEYKDVTAMVVNFNGRSLLYDGEKTPNELGTAYNFELDYLTIRMRAWEAYIKSTVIQTAIKQYCLWVVGSGLKFQSEPNIDFLNRQGIELNQNDFKNQIELSFRLFANSKQSTYSGEMNLHLLCAEALKNAIMSGDVLCVARYNKYQPTYEIIDGGYVSNPLDFTEEQNVIARGNRLIQGVEVDSKGSHVAYYVITKDLGFERILAYPSGTKGKRQAWLMYGLRHKITDTRGMSLLTAVMERDAKLDRFLEASVGAAEENSKIPYTFEHDQFSTGENPAMSGMAQAMGLTKQVVNETGTLEGYASKIQQTTSKQVYNLPVGSKLKTNITHTDPNFSNFYTPNAQLIYSTIGIPPEVAQGKYDGSYSGSRAANKGWEYKMKVERIVTLTEFFYKPIFEFWFLINIYKNNIQADGYRQSVLNEDWMLQNAYTQCRFIGQSVPHIDPVKEAQAERLKLGSMYDSIPLQSGEQSCENSNSGDFNEVQNIAQKELENNYFAKLSKQSIQVI